MTFWYPFLQGYCAVLKGPGRLSSISGGYGEGETPLPFPNRAVKPLRADGTWPARARESRSPPVSSAQRTASKAVRSSMWGCYTRSRRRGEARCIGAHRLGDRGPRLVRGCPVSRTGLAGRGSNDSPSRASPIWPPSSVQRPSRGRTIRACRRTDRGLPGHPRQGGLLAV